MVRESDYYIWLRDLVCCIPPYNQLLKTLDSIEYRWVFTLDANRASGGINLRTRYADEHSVNEDDVRTGPCTVLEMLIGVAEAMDDQLCCGLAHCFWDLIGNLGLSVCTDQDFDEAYVIGIIENLLDHNYASDGEGSLFPLHEYHGDCRNLDIWSQMNAWINENYPENDDWLN